MGAALVVGHNAVNLLVRRAGTPGLPLRRPAGLLPSLGAVGAVEPGEHPSDRLSLGC